MEHNWEGGCASLQQKDGAGFTKHSDGGLGGGLLLTHKRVA